MAGLRIISAVCVIVLTDARAVHYAAKTSLTAAAARSEKSPPIRQFDGIDGPGE